ncbi:uncharacterized protein LOC121382191 [Gigantopelta aegis]|uniref:uncharacterized protein LOC121382191 n=1 Tax=Gigantopelta aegis TaxID=1735272 RepID=UPI001B88D176|nr:uncharacterized protein LOC121382191 [Gigantopelta aegis]
MSMFHIQFPKRHGFLTWDELGCLARALGFQIDLFKSNVTGEISAESDGMLIQEILRMMEYKLLYRPLHQTVNMHTAEWNMTVIRKCLYLLNHHALTFEELHDIRMAYQVYEAADMKGMVEDQHILLRTLKMCSRTIAPMKLMHRIKHMKANFEEKGRIQLSEFLDLVLWCDVYKTFNPKEMEYSEGKEDQLFKLVDFQRLLTHYDDRVMSSLNANYLEEECGFERETFGTKQLPKEPPVRNQGRIMQARLDKRRYRHLKHEVTASQKRVYRAHAGSIRSRPVSVARLNSFRVKVERSSTSCTTAEQAYNSFRKKIRSMPSRGSSVYQSDTFSDRPQVEEYVRVLTPRAVSCQEKTEIEKKMESLKFAMMTMESRYLIKKEEEMDEYIPGYKEMIASRPLPPPTPEPKTEQKKEIRWTQDAAFSTRPFRSPPAHDRKCDARFRGWEPVKKQRGAHFILVSPFYESSERGIFFQRLYEKSRSQVQHVKDFDFLYRYTNKSQVEKSKGYPSRIRPITAPAALHISSEYSNVMEFTRGPFTPITHTVSGSAGGASGLSKISSLKQESKNANANSAVMDMSSKVDTILEKQTLDQTRPIKSPSPENFVTRIVKSPRIRTAASSSTRSSPKSAQSKKARSIVSAAGERRASQKSEHFSPDCPQQQKELDSKSNSGYSAFEENLEPYDSGFEDRRSSGAVRTSVDEQTDNDEEAIPVPSMQHSKLEIVEIGQIGKISLLEKIAESKDLEARFSQPASPVRSQTSSTLQAGPHDTEQESGIHQQASRSQRPLGSVLPLVKKDDGSSVPMMAVRETKKPVMKMQAVPPDAATDKAQNGSDEKKSTAVLSKTPKSEYQTATKVMETENKHSSSYNQCKTSPPLLNTSSPRVTSKMLSNMNIPSPKHSSESPRVKSKVLSDVNKDSPLGDTSQNGLNSASQKQVYIRDPKSYGSGFKSDMNTNSKGSDSDQDFTVDFAGNLAVAPRGSYEADQLQPDTKYWRLVERVNKLISNDLKVRLLTVSK